MSKFGGRRRRTADHCLRALWKVQAADTGSEGEQEDGKALAAWPIHRPSIASPLPHFACPTLFLEAKYRARLKPAVHGGFTAARLGHISWSPCTDSPWAPLCCSPRLLRSPPRAARRRVRSAPHPSMPRPSTP